eukprot:11581680-Alexandrium_andersonii.AAC.1
MQEVSTKHAKLAGMRMPGWTRIPEEPTTTSLVVLVREGHWTRYKDDIAPVFPNPDPNNQWQRAGQFQT